MTISDQTALARNFFLFQPHKKYDFASFGQLADFKKDIAGQIQGEIALFSEGWPCDYAAAAFSVAYDLCDEADIRLESGKIERLFNHSAGPVSYSENVGSAISDELERLISKANANSRDVARESHYDLEMHWNRIKEGDAAHRAIVFADSLSSHLEKAETIQLVGRLPIAPLLAAILLARPHCRELYYQPDQNSSKIKLF